MGDWHYIDIRGKRLETKFEENECKPFEGLDVALQDTLCLYFSDM